jgi:hypothetical protein
VPPQDLDATEAPAEPLALEGLEGQRHHALAEGPVDVQARPSVAEQPERQLGVLGDAPLVPATRLHQGVLADQSHRAGEDRAVPLVARRLRDREEVLVGVVEPPVERRLTPVAVVLRRLDEADLLVGEQRRAGAQELGVELVVGVDHADQRGARVDQFPQCVVEGPGLVARPVGEVGELHAVPEAPRLHRAPERLVVGVVVDHDDLVRRVVQRRERLQGLDDHLGWLVVGRHLQADEGELLVGHRPGRAVLDAAGPLLPAERVAQLPEVGHPEERRERLHHPQHQRADGAGDPEVADERPPQHVRQVGAEEVRRRRPGHVGTRAPPPRRREPDRADRDQPGHAGHRVRPGRVEREEHGADQCGEHGRDDHRQHQPPRGRPGARRTAVRRRGGEQRQGGERRGHETRQQERSQHRIDVLSGEGGRQPRGAASGCTSPLRCSA